MIDSDGLEGWCLESEGRLMVQGGPGDRALVSADSSLCLPDWLQSLGAYWNRWLLLLPQQSSPLMVDYDCPH